ncbi:unnamed protein product [Rhodiola kirilowii]
MSNKISPTLNSGPKFLNSKGSLLLVRSSSLSPLTTISIVRP